MAEKAGIFAKKKIGVMITHTVMVIGLACACADGQNTEGTLEPSDVETKSVTLEQPAAASEQPAAASEQFCADTDPAAVNGLTPDLDHDGIDGEVCLKKTDKGQNLVISEGDGWTWQKESSFTDRYQTSIFLCTLDGEDYLLRYRPDIYQGVCTYEYRLSVFEDNEERTVKQNRVDFDINFGAFFHKEFDPEAIAVFMHEVNELFSHSVQLLNTDEHLLSTFEKEGKLYDSLWWLDEWEQVYQRDENKSLLENMKGFQTAMTAAQTPADLEVLDGLPITEPLEMGLGIGVSAWGASLTLHPDGSFAGDYFSGNMDQNYPVEYQCQFHGRFGKVEKITDASWRLTLAELVIDTGHDVGEKWDETDEYGTVHYVSSEPYGFSDENDRVLEAGAQFILYSPEATGHEPGTELYGAVGFQGWAGKGGDGFNSADDKLNRWGLQNLTTGVGFFTRTQ